MVVGYALPAVHGPVASGYARRAAGGRGRAVAVGVGVPPPQKIVTGSP